MKKVYFIGIGPGDPELLTLKALRIIKEADLVIYPGSLISEEMYAFLKGENGKAEFYDAFGRSLEEILQKIKEVTKQKRIVVRLVSGDPALYSSIMEHIEALREAGFTYEIIPGVSSGFMASARLGIEFTYPELSNSVIFTRLSGKTGGAKEEEILKFAETRSTLVFFLSSGLVDRLSSLLQRVYPPETQVALLHRLSRRDEKIFLTSLSKLEETMQKEKITKTALIVVGDVLRLINENFYKRSDLYGKK